jgi:hypothetical protein
MLKKALGRGGLLLWAGIVSLVLSVGTLSQGIPDSASSHPARQPEGFSIETSWHARQTISRFEFICDCPARK